MRNVATHHLVNQGSLRDPPQVMRGTKRLRQRMPYGAYVKTDRFQLCTLSSILEDYDFDCGFLRLHGPSVYDLS